MKLSKLLAGLVFSFAAASSNALLMSEVADNAYITVDGYDIAWASPCAAVSPSCGAIDLSYQAQFGWEVLSEGLFNQLNISASDFVFDGANVDYATGNNNDEASGARLAAAYGSNAPGGDVAVAAPWFSHYSHVDWSNGQSGLWSFSDNNGVSYSETLVVRQSSVPEPSTFILMMLGLLGIAVSRKLTA